MDALFLGSFIVSFLFGICLYQYYKLRKENAALRLGYAEALQELREAKPPSSSVVERFAGLAAQIGQLNDETYSIPADKVKPGMILVINEQCYTVSKVTIQYTVALDAIKHVCIAYNRNGESMSGIFLAGTQVSILKSTLHLLSEQ